MINVNLGLKIQRIFFWKVSYANNIFIVYFAKYFESIFTIV